MSTLYARLQDAYAHLHAASIQRCPTDDAIIADHIEAAERLVKDALQEIESADPVITHPRPSYHKQAEGIPVFSPPGIRADDALEAWGTLVKAMNDDDGEAA